MFCKKDVLRNFVKFTGKHLCQSQFFNEVADSRALFNYLLNLLTLFIKKETLAQVFSCEFCEISKNTFFYRTPPVATLFSGSSKEKIEREWVNEKHWLLKILGLHKLKK